MGVPNGNPMGMRNKTPTWEWEWDGVLVNVDGYGNDSYSHGKNSHGFFLLRAEICAALRYSIISDSASVPSTDSSGVRTSKADIFV